MKFEAMEHPLRKNLYLLHISSKTVLFMIPALLVVLILFSLYQPSSQPHSWDYADDLRQMSSTKYCDIYSGEWIPNMDAPYYTNTTCWAIHEHQNCMKYGRPDSGFMKWRWKPHGCDLPILNPIQFLQLLRGKSMAFVGDSVSRNQLQSLICLLSMVEYPKDISYTSNEHFKRWRYESYNFTLAFFWSNYLVRSEEADKDGPMQTGLFNLYLDEPDDQWTDHISSFNYVIISGGHWFFRPALFYERRRLIGCHYCLQNAVPDRTMFYGYRRSFRTALRAINGLRNFTGITLLRTFSPSHFENGMWNEGGNCIRTRPFGSNETILEGTDLELYLIQMEEFKLAEREARERGHRFRLLDTTHAMLQRPDGHPSKYGHWPDQKVALHNDCVHWCLPGPIDTWNDFLLQVVKMEALRPLQERNTWKMSF